MIMGRMAAGLLSLAGTALLTRAARGAAGAALKAAARGIVAGVSGGGGMGGSGMARGAGRRGGPGGSGPLEGAVKDLPSRDRGGRGRCGAGGRKSPQDEASRTVIDATAADAPAGAAADGDPAPMDAGERVRALQALLDSVVSLVEGRVRLRHRAFRDAAGNAALAARLQATGRFTEVRFTPGTGSVLLRFDAARVGMADFLGAALPLGAHILRHPR